MTPAKKVAPLKSAPPVNDVRQLPADVGAERAILSAIMLDSDRAFPEIIEIVKPEDFSTDAHYRIAEAAWTLRDDGRPVDAVTIATQLKSENRLDQVGGTPYLADLTDNVPFIKHAATYATTIRTASDLRKLQNFGRAFAVEAASGIAPDELIRRAREALADIDVPAPAVPLEQPTLDEPLRGLQHLAKVALLGRKRLMELASQPVAYAWQDLVVEGTVAVIAGASGEGKTTLMFLVVTARANVGEPVTVLGCRVEPAPAGTFVVLVEGEHGESSTARKLIMSVELLGVDDAALDRIMVVARKAVVLGSPEWLDVVRLIRAGLVSDVVLDTLARVAPGDANSEQEQVAIFGMIAEAIDAAPAGKTKPTAWVLTHNKKNGSGGLEDVSGSVQRVGQADSVLMVEAERVAGRVVSSTVTFRKLREPPDEYPAPVRFKITKDETGKPSLITGNAGTDSADETPLEGRIVDLLRVEPRTQTALRDLLKRSWTDISAALTVLFAQKAIRTCLVKVRGQDRKAFELRSQFGASPKNDEPQPGDEFDELFDDGGNQN